MILSRRLPRLLASLALLGSVLTASPAAAQEALPLSQIDQYIETELKASRIPGMAVAIIKDRQVIHAQGYGVADADGRPVTAETPFIIGSTTKSFTALAIMQLVEAGKVELDAPVQRYLPWFTLADKEAAAKLTVRHLLNQTSGISTNAAFSINLAPDASLEAYVRELAKIKPTAQPGALWQYSNANYSTLGLLVELLSGQSYTEYVEQKILAPAGMKQTFLSQEVAAQNGLAAGHQYLFGFPVARNFPQKVSDIPAGFINASAPDLAKFLIALQSGRLLSPALVKEMQSPAAPMGGSDEFYAMGWMRRVHNGIPVIDHPGDVMNFKAYMALSVTEDWGVVLMANSNNSFSPEFQGIADGVLSLMAGKELPAGPGHSINRTMLFIGIALGLVLLWQLWGFARLPRWSRGGLWSYLRIAGNLALGLLIWAGIPAAMGFSWRMLWQFAPDLGISVAVIGTLSLLLGALRLVVGLRRSAPLSAKRAA